MNDLNQLLGDWQATKDVRTEMGGSVFTIPKGAIVAAKQADNEYWKVLVEAGPFFIDWKDGGWLERNAFEPCA